MLVVTEVGYATSQVAAPNTGSRRVAEEVPVECAGRAGAGPWRVKNRRCPTAEHQKMASRQTPEG